MSTLEIILAVDRYVQKLHSDAGFSPVESLNMRIKTAKEKLNAVTKHERKTEPYRAQWQERVAAYKQHVAALQRVLADDAPPE